MSLNGLDSQEITEAYRTALSEGGCWFLLKYTTRDEVKLLGKGNGGVTEAQETVIRHGEESPLYGFILYRRRKVVLRYLPDGTSRLLQARVAVHLQAIEDKFSPHDAVFAFASPAELKEASLHSEISLHTAASIKSTSESHLSGITEDEDTRSEATQKPYGHGKDAGSEVSPSASGDDVQARHDKVNEIISAMRSPERSSSNPEGMRPRTSSDTNKALPPPQAVSIKTFLSRISTVDSRMSTQSARPSAKDLGHAYESKPKVKLGPRPSTDSVTRQDALGGNSSFRPISTLPAGLRMPTRKTVPARPRSQQKNSNFSNPPPNVPLPPPPPIVPNHTSTKHSFPYSDRQTATVKSADQSSARMTPEKKRLMKALQLRQKHLGTKTHLIDDIKPREEAEVPQPAPNGLGIDTQSRGISEQPARLDDPVLNTTQTPVEVTRSPGTPPETHLDSTQDSQTTVQDSPISEPQPFDGHSTQPSSVSEDDFSSTKPSHYSDETVTEDNADSKPLEKNAVDEEPSSNKKINSLDPTPFRSMKGDEDGSSSSSSEVVEVPIMMTESPSESHIARKTRHGRQDSSTMEFGGDGQESETFEHVHTPILPVNHIQAEQPERAQFSTELSDSAKKSTHKHFLADPPKPLEDRNAVEGKEEFGSDHAPPESGTGYSLKPPSEQISDEILPPDPDTVETPTSTGSRDADGAMPTANLEEIDLSRTGLALDKPDDLQTPIPGRSEAFSESGDHLKTVEAPARAQSGHFSSDVNTISKGLVMNTPLVRPSNVQVNTPTIDNTSGTNDPETKSSTDDTIKRESGNVSGSQQIETKTSRHGLADATERASSLDQTEELFLSDDLFMEELKTAAVQEAKPMSVSKSPIRPVFSRNGTEQKPLEKPQTLRSFSGPGENRIKRDLSPSPQATASPTSVRSFSASNSPFLNQSSTFAAPPKKLGVSTSISQRIKALEQLSSRPTSPILQSTPQTNFISLRDRKSSLRSPPATADGTTFSVNSGRLNSKPQSPSTSPVTPNKIKADPLNRFSRARPESVSVTATIIRDLTDNGHNSGLSEPNATDLHPSPLVIERQSMLPPPLPPLQPPRPRYARQTSTRSGSSSGADTKKEASPRASRRDSFVSWRSLSSRNGSDLDLPRSTSDNSLNGAAGLDSVREEKKDSKRTRLLKRVSSISSMSRRSIASALSPGPKEASILEHQEPVASIAPSILDLGDVQVQFPDTLLWKPRHMMIDEHGTLVISPSSSDKNAKVLTKRFHLTDFRPPYLPDQDRQELANSVILDFKDGSTLQCACETPQGQASIFSSLRTVHSVHQHGE